MENQILTQKQWRIIFSVILVGLIILVAMFVYRSVVFRITGTSPDVSSVATVSPFFKITFNKELSKDILVEVSPSDTPNTVEIKGSSLTILFGDTLEEGQDYTVKLSGISTSKGAKMSPKIFRFTANNLPPSRLSDEQKQALLKSQEQYDKTILNDGLVQLLPFTGGGNEFQIYYTINDVNQKTQLVIVVDSDTQKGKEDALKWIEQVGFNPADYKISYVNMATSE